jgi:dimethylargininase
MTSTKEHTSWGPRLVASPTGALRAAVLVAPSPAIESARTLPGEPGAIYSRALAQQEILAKTLRYFGCEVTVLEPHTSDPYASAAVDAAIVFENGAVIMRPSSMSRRPESTWLEGEFVKRDVPIAGHIAPPGLIDGSDVLLAGTTAFIGVSKYSNSLGRGGFAQIAKAHGFNVVEVRLADTAPSLRAVAGVLSSDTVALAAPAQLDHDAFAGFNRIVAPLGDEFGAGVLNIGEHHVLADVRYPRVIDMMRKRGIVVEAIDLYDFGRVGITPSMLAVDLKRV